MADERTQDLGSLDRDVARAWTALVRWRAGLARKPDDVAGDDPIAPVRHVAGKSTWDALRALSPGLGEGPLRDALVPWVGVLTLARLGRDEEVEQAEAMAKATGRLAIDPVRLVTWREAWRGVARATSVTEAARWLDAAAEASGELAAIARRKAATRVEVARRLGLDHPWELLNLEGAQAPGGLSGTGFSQSGLNVGKPAGLRAVARRLLDATEDLARAVWKEAPGAPVGAAAVLHVANARDAGDGWPTRVTARWLGEVIAVPTAGLKIDLPALPSPAGAATFARALGAFGVALHGAWVPRAMPFALGHEPGERAARRLGFVLGALVADPAWQTRALGVVRRTALAQSRVLGRTLLLEARLQAARVLLADEADPSPRDLVDELIPRVFGAPLDARLRGAWPVARDDEPSRLVALIESRAAADGLRDRFDVDWFRNPRAWTSLRGEAASPERSPVDGDVLAAQADALARAFEGALG